MADCGSCKFAKWDYEEFSNSAEKWWFVSGCQKDMDFPNEEECEEYEQNRV